MILFLLVAAVFFLIYVVFKLHITVLLLKEDTQYLIKISKEFKKSEEADNSS